MSICTDCKEKLQSNTCDCCGQPVNPKLVETVPVSVDRIFDSCGRTYAVLSSHRLQESVNVKVKASNMVAIVEATKGERNLEATVQPKKYENRDRFFRDSYDSFSGRYDSYSLRSSNKVYLDQPPKIERFTDFKLKL